MKEPKRTYLYVYPAFDTYSSFYLVHGAEDRGKFNYCINTRVLLYCTAGLSRDQGQTAHSASSPLLLLINRVVLELEVLLVILRHKVCYKKHFLN